MKHIANTQQNQLPKIVLIIVFICMSGCIGYGMSVAFDLPAFELTLGSILGSWLIGLKVL